MCACIHTSQIMIDHHFVYTVLPIDRKWTHIRELVADKAGQTFLIRARVHTRRGAGEETLIATITNNFLCALL